MECSKCRRDADIVLPYMAACNSCFSGIIEKRVRKEVRLSRLIEKGDSILILDNGTSSSACIRAMLPGILHSLPVEVRTKKAGYRLGDRVSGRYTKVIIPWNQDRETDHFLECFLSGKQPRYIGHFRLSGKCYIKPLLFVSEEECGIYAKVHSLSYREERSGSFLAGLEKYPELRFNLSKNIRILNKIFKYTRLI